ncbi:hypothetical protein, partial [Gimesia maris]|uniref:hypothetical protein n=1 Tax=Gimesia maris TaxID=122 RepID=UPI003A90DE85
QTLSAEESYERFTVCNWTYRHGTEASGKVISITGPTAALKLEGGGGGGVICSSKQLLVSAGRPGGNKRVAADVIGRR